MEHVKIAVSLNRKLCEEGEALARELKISRSRLFALALEEFIRRRSSRRLLDRINAAYENAPDPSERALRRAMRRTHRRLMGRA
jgi:metal-responsive CopG/Arc/MetJ family transcriptional regulator